MTTVTTRSCDPEGVILPRIQRRGWSKPIPRRYEETRPSLIQSYTHDNILDLGQDFHSRLQKKSDMEKQVAVKKVEERVWKEAESQKVEAVDEMRRQLEAEHEKSIAHLNKKHERKLQEELIKLSTRLEQEAREELVRTKREYERLQREAVEKTEQLWQGRLLQAVDNARKEERLLAAQREEKLKQEHRKELERLHKKLSDEKISALDTLRQEKDKERSVAVETARKQEVEIGAEKLRQLNRLYEQQIVVLHSHISEHKQRASELEERLAMVTADRAQVRDELTQTRAEFQRFIDLVRPFNPSEAKYLIPPVKSFKD